MSSFLTPDTKISEEAESRKTRKVPSFTRNLFYLLLLIAVLGGVVWGIKAKPELLGLTKSAANNQKEAEELVAKVGKIIQLPSGETPTIATVTDLSKTKDREFFKNAKEGDKVLVYHNAKKAFLYRSSENKIIEVGIVNVNSEPEKQVAGDKTEIPVITPTPLPTQAPTETLIPTPRPTAVVTKAPTTTP